MSIARQAARGALKEWPLLTVLATTAVFLAFGRHLLADLDHPVRFASVLDWLSRTNVLLGAVHLVVFMYYVLLIFQR